MKYCPNCGASLMGGAASFCPECGVALRPTSDIPPGPAKEENDMPNNAEPEKVVHKAPVPAAPTGAVPAAEDKPAQKKKRKRRPSTVKARHEKTEDEDRPEPPADTSPPLEDGYDGYYEDILPIDEGQRKTEKLDPDMIKKVAMIAGGALLLVIIAIIALLLM
jgi:hypothetical protein